VVGTQAGDGAAQVEFFDGEGVVDHRDDDGAEGNRGQTTFIRIYNRMKKKCGLPLFLLSPSFSN
jgi:hypothetical protein